MAGVSRMGCTWIQRGGGAAPVSIPARDRCGQVDVCAARVHEIHDGISRSSRRILARQEVHR
jgi:hypothetical protein